MAEKPPVCPEAMNRLLDFRDFSSNQVIICCARVGVFVVAYAGQQLHILAARMVSPQSGVNILAGSPLNVLSSA